MRSNKFITFEGGEGSGKSTQIVLLSDYLRKQGIDCITTREPGGTPNAELIRKILVTGESKRWDAESEALLHFAARHAHLKNTVWPKLRRGTWVISDRFADSTMAYQGVAMGLGQGPIESLYQFAVGDFIPDLTFILDVPVALGLARARRRGNHENRYENMDTQFHERVRTAFLEIANREPLRCVVVDAQNTIDDTSWAIIETVTQRFDV